MASVTACAATYDSCLRLRHPRRKAGVRAVPQRIGQRQYSAGAVPVKVNAGHYWIAASVLQQAHIPLQTGDALVDVTTLPSVKVEYDQPGQILKLQVPDKWLPSST